MQPCGDQGNGVVKVSLQSNRLKYHDENITVFLEHCEKNIQSLQMILIIYFIMKDNDIFKFNILLLAWFFSAKLA